MCCHECGRLREEGLLDRHRCAAAFTCPAVISTASVVDVMMFHSCAALGTEAVPMLTRP